MNPTIWSSAKWKAMAMAAASAAVLGMLVVPATAQHATQTKQGASVIVDGVVREVFRSPRQDRVDYVVQIEVNRSDYGESPADPRHVHAPAPGEQIFVHVFRPLPADQGKPGVLGHTAIPAEGTGVRAYLYPRDRGGWDGAFPDWFDRANVSLLSRGGPAPELEPPTEVGPVRPARPAELAREGSLLHRLGLRVKKEQVDGRLVLKVVDVVPDSPAGQAGIERGDALIDVNGGAITNMETLSAAVHSGAIAVRLGMLNSRTGKRMTALVDVTGLTAAEAAERKARPVLVAGEVPSRELGVNVKKIRVGLHTTAVQVTEVWKDSPAARAGLEPGDIIISANHTPIEDVESLNAVARRSGPVMTLKIFDPRSRREVSVPVRFNPGSPAPSGHAAPQRGLSAATKGG
ncbi:MAG: PDZ domain-containing protein [Isosphaeraceae bacterium]